MTQADTFLERVERFLESSGMTPTGFGREAVGDPKLVFELRDGREPRRKTRERILKFIEQASATTPSAA